MNQRILVMMVGILTILALPALAVAQTPNGPPTGLPPIPDTPAGSNPVGAPPVIELPINAPSVMGVPTAVPPVATTPLTVNPGVPPVETANGEGMDNAMNNPVIRQGNGPLHDVDLASLEAPPTLNPFIEVPASPPDIDVIGGENQVGAPPVIFGAPPAE